MVKQLKGMIPIDSTNDWIGKTVIAVADYTRGAASVGVVSFEIEIPKQVKQTWLEPLSSEENHRR